MLALLTSAYAQGMGAQGMGKGRNRANAQRTEERKKPEDDKAYKNALDKIPAAEQKPDPWKNMR